ncbi:MAG: hypothetical protein LC777_01900 [Actinobacteria bacterium]|nr:hypothetical protein [Actinomycetota bacterium]
MSTSTSRAVGRSGYRFDCELDPGFVANQQTPILRVACRRPAPAALDVADGAGSVSQQDALADAPVVLLLVEPETGVDIAVGSALRPEQHRNGDAVNDRGMPRCDLGTSPPRARVLQRDRGVLVVVAESSR